MIGEDNRQGRPIRVYVAAPSSDLDAARELMATVRDAGFEITHDWTVGLEGEVVSDWPLRCQLDINGVIHAEVVIADVRRRLNNGGPLIEIGAALGAGIPVVSVGSFHRFFEAHPLVKVCSDLTRACLMAASVALHSESETL
jgi:hypothetical protein